MTVQTTARSFLAIAAACAVAVSLAACQDATTPSGDPQDSEAATVDALPPEASDDEPAAPESTETTSGVRLPEDGNAVVVQVAKISHDPWEPAILAQMTPSFSLQADGSAYFRYPGGPSPVGWYSVELTEEETIGCVTTLASEAAVLRLSADLPEPDIGFKSKDDGSAAGIEGVYVIYVRSAEEQGRLVIESQLIDDPSGPHAEELERLQLVLKALDLWRAGVDREYSAAEVEAIRREMGWWNDSWEPYVPDSAVAFATLARTSTPEDAPSATWPLEVPLSDSVTARYPTRPNELIIEGEDVVAVLENERERESSIFGPLWRGDSSDRAYLVGIRTVPPGVNHVVVEYTYYQPKPTMGLQLESED